MESDVERIDTFNWIMSTTDHIQLKYDHQSYLIEASQLFAVNWYFVNCICSI